MGTCRVVTSDGDELRHPGPPCDSLGVCVFLFEGRLFSHGNFLWPIVGQLGVNFRLSLEASEPPRMARALHRELFYGHLRTKGDNTRSWKVSKAREHQAG